MGWWGCGPCDFSVSPNPFGLDFGTLDLGLTIKALFDYFAGQSGTLNKVLRFENSAKKLSNDAAARIKV